MSKKYIDIVKVQYLRGPSIWAYRPIIEAVVDIGDLEDFPSNKIPGLYERLTAWLPSLIEHRCSVGERGGFLQRLRDGTWPAHILEHVTLELQGLAGMPGGLGRARETSIRGVYKVIVRAWYEELTRAALYAGRDLLMAAIEDRPFDVKGTVEELRDLAESLRLGPSTDCIVSAADDRDIPMIRLSDANLVQLGYGAAQRRIWTAETDRTSAIAEGVSRDKDLTKQLLSACGVPVPEGELVESAEEAWEAAQSIGLPVVVKPLDGNHGRGVFMNLSSQADIETAFGVAADEGSGVMVERCIEGDEHRLLVVGGRMVAAARGDVASIRGDGDSTVTQLIDSQINADPRRGSDEDHPLNTIRLDSAARLEIGRQGFDADSVVPEGVTVVVQRNGNVSIDVTDKVHPSVAAAVVLAARVVGLDIAGVDLVARDISRPLAEQGGAIVEVNAGPGLLMHLRPAGGEPRPVGEAIVDHLFAENANSRIPLVGVCGSDGRTMVARIVAWLLQINGWNTGLACSNGLFFGRRQVETKDCATWEEAQRVLLNRTLQAGVIETTLRGIVTEGMAYDRCQVGVVTSLDPTQTMPDQYIEDADALVKVVRTQVDVVLPEGATVLNADDGLVAEMASLSDGEVIFFGLDGDTEVMREHLRVGKRAVFVQQGEIVLARGRKTIAISKLADIAFTRKSPDPYKVTSILAAAAAAWALDLDPALIRTGVQTFGLEQADISVAPDSAAPALEVSV